MSKTSARRIRQQQRLAAERSSGRAFLAGVVALVAFLGVALVISSSRGDTSTAPPTRDAEERLGSASALGLVADAKTVALGHVPLDQTVTPAWKLTNDGTGEVALGEPHAEVVEGCCPGPLQVAKKTLGPGESTELTFPLQMHAGMDGPHEFRIHVPIEREGEQELLELTTTGHFSI